MINLKYLVKGKGESGNLLFTSYPNARLQFAYFFSDRDLHFMFLASTKVEDTYFYNFCGFCLLVLGPPFPGVDPASVGPDGVEGLVAGPALVAPVLLVPGPVSSVYMVPRDKKV